MTRSFFVTTARLITRFGLAWARNVFSVMHAGAALSIIGLFVLAGCGGGDSITGTNPSEFVSVVVSSDIQMPVGYQANLWTQHRVYGRSDLHLGDSLTVKMTDTKVVTVTRRSASHYSDASAPFVERQDEWVIGTIAPGFTQITFTSAVDKSKSVIMLVTITDDNLIRMVRMK